MKRKRSGTSAFVVVIAHQRHAGREVERLAESFQRTHGHKMPEFAAPTGRDGDKAPEQAPAQNEVFAPKSVADVACQRRAGGINPHESRPNESELHLVEAKLFFELGEHRED